MLNSIAMLGLGLFVFAFGYLVGYSWKGYDLRNYRLKEEWTIDTLEDRGASLDQKIYNLQKLWLEEKGEVWK